MVAKNEEGFIEKSLESVKDIVDEIIVVDNESTDRTAEIAKSMGAQVFSKEWTDNFAELKNFCLKKATGDWILFLDADETISKKDLEKVRKLLESDADAISFLIRTYTNNEFLHKFVHLVNDKYEESKGFKGYEAVYNVRLFRNNKKIMYRRRVHEILDYALEELGANVKHVDIPIHHFKELKGEEVEKKKKELYEKLNLKVAKEDPNDPKSWFDKGFFHFKKGEFEESIENYKKALELNSNYIEPYFGLAEAYVAAKDYQKAIDVMIRLSELDPILPSVFYNLGELFMGTRQYENALKAYERALELGSSKKQRIEEILPQLRKIISKG